MIRPALAALVLAAATAAPARAEVESVAPPVVEAIFLCDPVPPSGIEFGLAFLGRQAGPGGLADFGAFDTQARLQAAFAIGERFGLSADVGLGGPRGLLLDSPSASLKALLRDGGDLGPSLGASLDLLGASHSLTGTELGLGLGGVLPAGRITWRASLSAASAAVAWAPHLHGGVSAAMAVGPRLRLLVEAVATIGVGGPSLAAGPGFKVALDERTALAGGAMLGAGRGADPLAVTVVLTRAL